MSDDPTRPDAEPSEVLQLLARQAADCARFVAARVDLAPDEAEAFTTTRQGV